jgi:2-polyprenyl-3-methyl-5-hydroxy-6-metoxy-1,4-benzoquinol methylase
MYYPKYRNYLPGQFTIDGLSLALIPFKSQVLELGCGDGKLTEYLKKKLHCRITTVELYKENAANVRGLAEKIIIGDVETKSVQQKIGQAGQFDVVYMSALLGSLIDPETILICAKKWLKKDGFIVVTLPNILHFSMRLHFLFGKFEYVDHGLCSREHLRFFTLKTARELMKKCGYEIIYQDYDLVGFPRLEKMLYLFPRRCFRLFYGFFPGLFTYQLVFKLVPHEKTD